MHVVQQCVPSSGTTIIHPPPQRPRYPRTLFSPCLSDGQEYVCPWLVHLLSKPSHHASNWFPHSGTIAPSAVGCTVSPNPNVVWRRALSICCHCTRQNPLRRESRVLNVSGVANVGIAVAVALRTENRDTP
jgi:hypothetical protein